MYVYIYIYIYIYTCVIIIIILSIVTVGRLLHVHAARQDPQPAQPGGRSRRLGRGQRRRPGAPAWLGGAESLVIIIVIIISIVIIMVRLYSFMFIMYVICCYAYFGRMNDFGRSMQSDPLRGLAHVLRLGYLTRRGKVLVVLYFLAAPLGLIRLARSLIVCLE